eukprot:evm.model.scf_244.8 EVM.evm.TU.scf_244.8   scf_244:61137-70082(-)
MAPPNQTDVGRATLLKELGNALVAEGDYEAAGDAYTKAIQAIDAASRPSDAAHLLGALHSNRSLCRLQLHDHGGALADAKDAIHWRPDWSRGHLREAMALEAEGRGPEARAAAARGLELDPEDRALREWVGNAEGPPDAKRRREEEAEGESVIHEALKKLEESGVRIDKPLPVTMLSGFLGSGKTTLLNRVLSEWHGQRIAVIVNDMAGINVDAEVIRKAHGLEATDEQLVEMTNGCICCTLRGDLIDGAVRLLASGKYDFLLIESTGISEPMPVAATFTTSDAGGFSLSKYFTVDNMVTVVDALRFKTELQCGETLQQRRMEGFEGDERTIAHLLLDQVEFADTILMNKCDLVDGGSLARLQSFLELLNPRARVLRTVRCDVDLKEVIDTKRFNMEAAQQAPGFATELAAPHTPETEEYGIRSTVYESARPFHPARLYKAIYASHTKPGTQGLDGASIGPRVPNGGTSGPQVPNGDTSGPQFPNGSAVGPSVPNGGSAGPRGPDEGPAGPPGPKGDGDSAWSAADESVVGRGSFLSRVLRSKGFFYLASAPDAVIEWSTAGKSVQFGVGGRWLCSMVPRELWAAGGWDPQWGDRQQKIVFIGEDLNVQEVGRIMDECLLTDDEILLGEDAWKSFGEEGMWDIDLEEDDGESGDEDGSESGDEEGSESSDGEGSESGDGEGGESAGGGSRLRKD